MPPLARYERLGDLVDVVGQRDDESDAAISALLALPHDDEMVVPVVLVGLRRLLLLCRGSRRALLDDLVSEVAIAIGELRHVRPLTHRRRLAYVIVDRARDRQRAGLRRQRGWYPIDGHEMAGAPVTSTCVVEDEALDRVVVASVRARVAASEDPGLCRSWNSLVELVDLPRRSQAERDRWKYIRRRLGAHLTPDAA